MYRQVIILDYGKKYQNLCRARYHNHPKGCPNYGVREDCPPGVPPIYDQINPHCPIIAVYNEFDFGTHRRKMKKKHPEWSERQLRCCLYWQQTARKFLKKEIKKFLKTHPDFFIVKNPEAAGVNLTETMKKVGIFLEWPPEEKTFQIVLAGKKVNMPIFIDSEEKYVEFFGIEELERMKKYVDEKKRFSENS